MGIGCPAAELQADDPCLDHDAAHPLAGPRSAASFSRSAAAWPRPIREHRPFLGRLPTRRAVARRAFGRASADRHWPWRPRSSPEQRRTANAAHAGTVIADAAGSWAEVSRRGSCQRACAGSGARQVQSGTPCAMALKKKQKAGRSTLVATQPGQNPMYRQQFRG